MSMFNSVPSVLKRYKQLVGLGIASAMLIAIFVPSQNIPITSGTRLCGVYYGHDYGPCPVNKPDVDKEKHREGTHHATIINNHVTIINQAISIAIASASASAASASWLSNGNGNGNSSEQQQRATGSEQQQQRLLLQLLVLRGLQLLLELLPRPPLQLLLLWLRMVVLRQQLQLLATLRHQHPPRPLLSLQRMTVNLLRAWLQRLHLPKLLLIVSHQPRPPCSCDWTAAAAEGSSAAAAAAAGRASSSLWSCKWRKRC